MYILGISAYYHDSAAVLLVDGAITAAAQEERFSRRKHDHRFPEQAIGFCLKQGKIRVGDLDYVVFYDKPLLKFDRLLETYLAFAPRGFSSFSRAIPLWLKQKLHLKRELRRRLGKSCTAPVIFPEHHESHAASAFFPSPFDEAAILTVDGVGEWATASLGEGRGNRVTLLKEMRFPHSLGLLYSAFTYYCGFRVNSGEYKLMGLAPYGKPVYRDRILEKLVRLYPDGSIWMDQRYFNYSQGLTMTSAAFHQLFDGPPRRPESELTQREMDLAASVQSVTEEAILRMARYAREQTGLDALCLAGGVALNCVANGKILREKIFRDLFIQPAAGDAGGALGGALFLWHQLLDRPRTPEKPDSQQGSLLGPRFGNEEIQAYLEQEKTVFHRIPEEAELLDRVSDAIAGGQVVGWFQGRMEFGPRALGSRSIIGDARSLEMQSLMNRKIKFRESFRPFAPCVLEEDAAEYFDLDRPSPYMLLVAPVHPKQRRKLTEDEEKILTGGDLRARVNLPRSTIPAVTHVDGSARVQTVDEPRHGRYYRLIRRFKEKTGVPVMINTSFNIRGEPIVGTPENAYHCFLNTDMDVLVLEDFVLFKNEQPVRSEQERERYREEFPLD